jgi:hypothetical protein
MLTEASRCRAGGLWGALEERRMLLSRRFALALLGEAEVDDADAAVAVDEGVVGFEVAVDDAGLVGRVEAGAGLQEHGEDLAPRARWSAARRGGESPRTYSMARNTWSSTEPTS